MSAAQQSGEPARDFGSPATWGDVEQARLSLEMQLAELRTEVIRVEGRLERKLASTETRLIRWSAGLAAAAGVAIIGFLVGILQAVD